MLRIRFSHLLLGLFLLGSTFVLSACTLPWKQQFSGLTVQAAEGSSFQVYLNDLHLGQAPIQKDDIKPGTYRLKLDPGDGKKIYEGQIRLYPGSTSVVLWSFAGAQPTGTGEILELEPLPTQSRAEVSVITVPEGSTVQLNNTTYGLSPVILDEAQPGQYSLSLNAVGHIKKSVTVQITPGYRLNVFSRLERSSDSLDTTNVLTAPTEATSTATMIAASPTPVPSTSATPMPSTATAAASLTPGGAFLTVKETGTGWLRVRAEPNATAAELAKVNVGTKHNVKQIQSGWYQIEYEVGKLGWVSGQFVDYSPGT